MKNKNCITVPIVGDGGISDPQIGDARIFPVLIVDCKLHKALEDLIHIHKDTPPGDVIAVWSWNLFSRENVYLTLKFQRPVETSAMLCFNSLKQCEIVDWIINVRGLILQPLSSGAKVSEGMGKPKIIVEVPASATFPKWNSIYQKCVEKKYLSRGLSKKIAKEAANLHIARMREIPFRRTASKHSQNT